MFISSFSHILNDDENNNSHTLKPKVMSDSVIKLLNTNAFDIEIHQDEDGNSNVDFNSLVIVSMDTLLKLNVFNQSLVQINEKFTVTIFGLEDIEEDFVAFLSPLLMFNIGGDEVIYIQPYLSEEIKESKEIQLETSSKITLARVKSSKSDGYRDYGKEIRNYFKTKRILNMNDIVAIPILQTIDDEYNSESDNDEEESYLFFEEEEDDDDEEQKEEEGEEEKVVTNEIIKDINDYTQTGYEIPKPFELLYFKILDIGKKDKSYIVDAFNGLTIVTQIGSVNSRIPNSELCTNFLANVSKINKSEHLVKNAIPNAQEIESSEELHDVLLPLIYPLKLSENENNLDNALILLHGKQGTGKRLLVSNVAKNYGLHLKEISLTKLRGLNEDDVVKKLQEISEECENLSPCLLHFRHFKALAPMANGNQQPDDPNKIVDELNKIAFDFKRKILLICSTDDVEDIPSMLRCVFTHEIEVKLPSLENRKDILQHFIDVNHISINDVKVEDLATKTAGRSAIELKQLMAEAGLLAIKAKESFLTTGLIDKALDNLPSTSMAAIGAPKIPSVYWDDVGGLGEAKDEITSMITLPLKRPDLFLEGVKQRSGILLFGPPGTGKTLLAKAVATECNLNFISVKGPELLDMYIGESERKVRQVFETARNAAPSVLFFDELDSLAPKRGVGSDSGGVMDRVVSQLLTELDGMTDNKNQVFVIGATNRPDLLDESLLRPGRFDRLIYLGISKDREQQMKILKALTRKYKHEEKVDLIKVLEGCPLNFTGADMYALASSALSNALQRRVEEILETVPKDQVRKYLATLEDKDLEIKVNMQDYIKAASTTIPSVSPKEIKHYEQLRSIYATNAANEATAAENDTDEAKNTAENGEVVDKTAS